MNFKEIKYNAKRSKPRIIFSVSNTIRFPMSLIEKYKLEGKKSVRIFVDEKEDKFCIGFVFVDEEGNYLKFSQSKSGGFVSGNSLFSTIGINPKEMKSKDMDRKFDPILEEFEDKEMLVIEVKKIV